MDEATWPSIENETIYMEDATKSAEPVWNRMMELFPSLESLVLHNQERATASPQHRRMEKVISACPLQLDLRLTVWTSNGDGVDEVHAKAQEGLSNDELWRFIVGKRDISRRRLQLEAGGRYLCMMKALQKRNEMQASSALALRKQGRIVLLPKWSMVVDVVLPVEPRRVEMTEGMPGRTTPNAAEGEKNARVCQRLLTP